MNANLLLNSISNPLSKNKMEEVKNIIISLPWTPKDNNQATEKLLIAPEISGRWIELEPSLERRFWFRTIELFVKDYILVLTSHDSANKTNNKFSWQRRDDVLASSKEW